MIAQTTTSKRAPFKKKEGPTDVDTHVGRQLRVRRSLMGLTQESVAQATGLTFQQIQKYEQGKNRISASRLLQFCTLLNVEPNYFFESLMTGAGATLGLGESAQEPILSAPSSGVMTSRETIDLLRAYYAISDVKLRKNILTMMKQMAETHTDK
jgi:transcriptional regulator with XRE-family HTH domain